MHGGRPRLRHRPRLSAPPCGARVADRRVGSGRLRVSAGGRAGAVALPGPEQDRRGARGRDGRRRGPVSVGWLITADFALELGRDVFAVPGEITSGLSAGTNELLRQGASPLLAAADVLDAMGVEPKAPAGRSVSSAAEDVLALVSDGFRDPDALVRASGCSSGDVAAALVELELAGLVATADGEYRAVVAV